MKPFNPEVIERNLGIRGIITAEPVAGATLLTLAEPAHA